MRVPDIYDVWEYEQRKRENELAKRQWCDICDTPILDDSCYYINGDYICDDCMEIYRVDTPVED